MSSLLIKKISSMQPFSHESQRLLVSCLKQLKQNKHGTLLQAGEVCKNIYYLESGLAISSMNCDGKRINLNFTLPDNFITNLSSLRTDTPSEYDIQIYNSANVWSISKTSLFKLYQESDEICRFGRHLLEQLLADMEQHANLFKIKNPTERYQHILLMQPDLLQKITLTQLASYIGISRETLSRIRKFK